MTEPLYAVYGASGFGREILPIARQALIARGISRDRLIFIDDALAGQQVNQHGVYSYAGFLSIAATERHVAIAIANSRTRQTLAMQCHRDQLTAWNLRADSVVSMDDVTMGVGYLLSPFVTLTANIKIGSYFQANLYSYIGHDCIIGDYVTFAPRVSCNGNVVIEDHAYIGTGAILKQGTPDKPLVIGRGAVVGMGAVVTKSVPAGVTVVGNPARILQR
jgi:sugar O-acyltransferase (sialic acid O-acetyltransferase NeuD family)